jgi:hypothetical protein
MEWQVKLDKNDPAVKEKVREIMTTTVGPSTVDSQIRQAISVCWAMLPEEKRTVAGVEAEIRRQVERALKDLRDDAAAFGVPPG